MHVGHSSAVMRYATHSPRPLSRASLVIGLYGAMTLGALLLAAGRGDPDLYRLELGPAGWLLASPAIGLAVGLTVVAASRWATGRFAWAQALHQSFRDLLGPLTGREVLILAG